MNPLTRRDILAHQNAVPWPVQRQVEQDLLLCLAMAALFNDKFLHSQIAMRGGTLLHKVHLSPAARYSEDIDLVIYGDRPEDIVNERRGISAETDLRFCAYFGLSPGYWLRVQLAYHLREALNTIGPKIKATVHPLGTGQPAGGRLL